MSVLPIDFLCSHFKLNGFDCGNETLNAGLQNRLVSMPDPDEVTLLVAHEDRVIRGYAAISNLTLVLDRRDATAARCFFIGALAVDDRWRGTDLAPALLTRCYNLKRQRGRRKRFAATVVTSLFDDELEARFRRQRFKPVSENPLLWYKLTGS